TSYLIMLSACKKENKPDNSVTTGRIKSLQVNWGLIPGVLRDKIDFVYDNSGRVQEINAYNILANPSSGYDSVFNLYFEYNGNNQLPFKFRYIYYVGSANDIHYLTYDNNLLPIKDSALVMNTVPNQPPFFLKKSTFTYSGNSVICRDSFPINSFRSHILTNSNENFISWEEIPLNRASDTYYEFDNYTNPLNKLNVAPIFHIVFNEHLPSGGYWAIWTLCNKNNITKLKKDFYATTGLYHDTLTFKFSYLPDGRPDNRIVYNRFGWPEDTIYYFYQ
ncbi:MAG: hypothetical protein ABL876_17170, partial [Chitinophagaceae bacterium]